MTWIDEQPREKVDAGIAKLSQRQLDNGCGEPSFALWLALVDNRMVRAVGVTHRDIGDWNWRDSFDAGDRPAEAALDALLDDDLYGSLMAELS